MKIDIGARKSEPDRNNHRLDQALKTSIPK
jgi:hypothetical protein